MFINGLISEIESSRLCCKIQDISSSAAGYADDLTTTAVSKNRTDKIKLNSLVYEYGNKWRCSFNAKKSAVLVYGESLRGNVKNAEHRIFKLGPDRISEKQEYDHVGIKASIDPRNKSRVLERNGKSRRTLNATTGLGNR